MPSYQIIVVNIKYGDSFRPYHGDRPESMTLDLPKDIAEADGRDPNFEDLVESFAYNTITRSFGSYVCRCQVFLPNKK
jgi:hypothetical protein